MYGNIDKSAAACVERGAAWLDAVRPRWVDLVDLDTLEMTDAYQCVLGQVFATDADPSNHNIWTGYRYGRDVLLSDMGSDDYDEMDAIRRVTHYGFSCDDYGDGYPANYNELTPLWTDAILARR